MPGYGSYVHPFFNEADRELGNLFFTNACLRRRGQAADANPQDFFLAAELARQHRAPVYVGEGTGTDYAYHFDAGRLGAFLRAHAVGLGVRHVVDTVARVELHTRTATSPPCSSKVANASRPTCSSTAAVSRTC